MQEKERLYNRFCDSLGSRRPTKRVRLYELAKLWTEYPLYPCSVNEKKSEEPRPDVAEFQLYEPMSDGISPADNNFFARLFDDALFSRRKLSMDSDGVYLDEKKLFFVPIAYMTGKELRIFRYWVRHSSELFSRGSSQMCLCSFSEYETDTKKRSYLPVRFSFSLCTIFLALLYEESRIAWGLYWKQSSKSYPLMYKNCRSAKKNRIDIESIKRVSAERDDMRVPVLTPNQYLDLQMTQNECMILMYRELMTALQSVLDSRYREMCKMRNDAEVVDFRTRLGILQTIMGEIDRKIMFISKFMETVQQSEGTDDLKVIWDTRETITKEVCRPPYSDMNEEEEASVYVQETDSPW